MPPLKSGRVQDFSGGMAEAMEQALDEEWQALKGVALPSEGMVERRVLLVGIARGVLRYLKAHQHEVLTSITLAPSDSATVVRALDLNVSES